MAESQAQLKLKKAFKHQSPTGNDRVYALSNVVIVWREKIVNNLIGEFFQPFSVLHHDERSKTLAIDQNGAIKRD